MQIFRRRAEDARVHKKQQAFSQKLLKKEADITAELAREERLLAKEAAALQVQPGLLVLGCCTSGMSCCSCLLVSLQPGAGPGAHPSCRQV